MCTIHEINDVSFVGVIGPDGTPGFDLWVGGGLSTNPMMAQRLGVFVRPDQVREAWVGVISIFRDYGYRRLRTRARLKFLVADWGAAKFREVLEKEYLGYALPDGPAADRACSTDGATMSASTLKRTVVSTSGSLRASVGSAARSSTPSPTSRRPTAAAGCTRPSSRR